MKTITRSKAIQMFINLGNLPLGHLDETTLSATLDNFEKLRKVQEDYQHLAEELRKRLYEGVDEERMTSFFSLVEKYEPERNQEKRDEYLKMMKDSYAELYPIYEKHLMVLEKLSAKEIDVDFSIIDRTAFMKGIAQSSNGVYLHNLTSVFEPMLTEEEVKTDLSELDDLLK